MVEDFPDLAAAAAAAATVFTISTKDSIYSHVAKTYPVTQMATYFHQDEVTLSSLRRIQKYEKGHESLLQRLPFPE
jgi:hypothetical protein